MRPSGNAILVTGGGSGIGLHLARAFVRDGNRVAICGRDQGQLDDAHQAMPDLLIRRCDLADTEQRSALVDWALDRLPDLNVVVNNAGIAGPVDLTVDALDVDTVERQLLIDLSVPVDLTLRFLPHLRRQPSAALVFVSSGLVYSFDASSPAYSAAKAGIHAWAESVRYQLKDTGVAVFEVLPPTVDTRLTPDFDAEAMETLKAISPAEVAVAVMKGLADDTTEIRIGRVKLLYAASRVAPEATDRMINAEIEKVRGRKPPDDGP